MCGAQPVSPHHVKRSVQQLGLTYRELMTLSLNDFGLSLLVSAMRLFEAVRIFTEQGNGDANYKLINGDPRGFPQPAQRDLNDMVQAALDRGFDDGFLVKYAGPSRSLPETIGDVKAIAAHLYLLSLKARGVEVTENTAERYYRSQPVMRLIHEIGIADDYLEVSGMQRAMVPIVPN
jgi:hypothetical protein